MDAEPRDGGEASWTEPGIRMQIGAWDRAPVDADKEKDPNNMNVDEVVLVKPYPSEERCCIHDHLCKAVPLTGRAGSARGLPLQGPGVRNLRPESLYPRVGSPV